MGVTCFWVEETGTARVGLRRYSKGGGCREEGGRNFHAAILWLDTAPLGKVTEDGITHWGEPSFTYPDHADPRWPAACGCGFAFPASDGPGRLQNWDEPLYRRTDTGELTTLRNAPDGAMWDAWWLPWKGPDGRSLEVICPGGGRWNIDGRASNCGSPGDNEHRCWIRHGEPPALTVDKDGNTCVAGGGSIVAGDYHGFLRAGAFT